MNKFRLALGTALVTGMALALVGCDDDGTSASNDSDKESVVSRVDTLYVLSKDTVYSVERDTVYSVEKDTIYSYVKDTVVVQNRDTLVVFDTVPKKYPSCAGVLYNPDEIICYKGNLIALCHGFVYNPDSAFCYNDSLYSCDG